MSAPSLRVRLLTRVLRRLQTLPGPLRDAIRGGVPVNDRGDPLDAALATLCRLQNLQPQDLTGRSVDLARSEFVDSCTIVAGDLDPVERVVDREVPGPAGPIRTRWYEPADPPEHALVFLHGGGWVVGDLDSHDVPCRILASRGRQVVIAVDYALAPERPFPAGHDDAVAAFRAIRAALAERGIHRVGLGGDSAGGNLTAAVCLALRDAGEPQPDVQMLVYPATDLRRQHASHRTFATGFLLTAASIDWYLERYAAPLGDLRASVGLADPSGLAPAVVVTAGFDPLRDEGEVWAERMAAAGVPVTDLRLSGMVHGFFNMGALASCRAAIESVVDAVDARRRG